MICDRFLCFAVPLGMHSLVHHLQNLRAVKSPSEINLLRKAGEIGVNGFKQVLIQVHFSKLISVVVHNNYFGLGKISHYSPFEK